MYRMTKRFDCPGKGHRSQRTDAQALSKEFP
jgi:hypothetical protein